MVPLTLPERLELDLPNFRDADTVELIVGEGPACFVVHKGLLCNTVAFFDKAFNSTFKEGERQRIDLPEDSPSTVHAFVQWVYFKSYSLPKDQQETFDLLARLFIFADKVLAAELKLDTIRWYFHLRSTRSGTPQQKVIEFVFESTPEGSPLRALMADWYAWHVDLVSFQSAWEGNPRFATMLVSRLANRLKDAAESPFTQSAAAYLNPTGPKE